MTIVIQGINYNLDNFLFKNIILRENSLSYQPISDFLTKWISGGKDFEIRSSGSTGEPKLIVLKRKWLETSALQTIQLLNLWEENVLCCIPTHKIGGLMMLVRALAGGFDIQIDEPKSDPMKEIDTFHSFTFVSLVSSQLVSILKSDSSIAKLNRFKNILLGGSEISSELMNKLENLTPNIYHTYGMTETCSHIALKKLNNGPWLHFKPNPYVELKTNENQLLSIKGFQSGSEWINTNDVVNLYVDGSFDFIGRADFVINTGGYKIFPEQLELKIKAIFNNLNWQSEAIITSHPHELWGEEVVLIITTNLPHQPKEILAMLKPSLEKFELPKRVLQMESIPYNEGGKIDRRQLKQMTSSD